MSASIIERLRSNEPLPVCPFDRLSPHYWTMPDDKPCPICGQENTSEGPDKCRGADTRVMKEAADAIERLAAEAAGWKKAYEETRDLAALALTSSDRTFCVNDPRVICPGGAECCEGDDE